MVRNGRPRRTPIDYLLNILDRAIDLGLISREEYAVSSSNPNIQSQIDLWRPKVQHHENIQVRKWVLAVPCFDSSVFEQVSDKSYQIYSDATKACGEFNFNSVRKVKCRVVEESITIPFGQSPSLREGRSAIELIENVGACLMSSSKAPEITNGYLALANKGLVSQDIPGVIELCFQLAVTQMGLSHNNIGSNGAQFLAKSLLENIQLPKLVAVPEYNICNSIIALFLSSNQIRDDGAIAIASIISSGSLPQLIKVGLNDNEITDAGACALASSIDCTQCHSTLQVLGLSENRITSNGALAIASALENNAKMTRLFLNSNIELGTAAAISLVTVAKGHPTLRRLGLACCSANDDAALAMLQCLVENKTLERICCFGNSFSEKIVTEMKYSDTRFNFHAVKN